MQVIPEGSGSSIVIIVPAFAGMTILLIIVFFVVLHLSFVVKKIRVLRVIRG